MPKMFAVDFELGELHFLGQSKQVNKLINLSTARMCEWYFPRELAKGRLPVFSSQNPSFYSVFHNETKT